MKQTVQTTFEFSFDEIKALLQKTIESTQKTKVESIKFDNLKGTVTFICNPESTKTVVVESRNIGSLFNNKNHSKRNFGLIIALREAFEDGSRWPVNKLAEHLRDSGFNMDETKLYAYLSGNYKKDFIQVERRVFQSKEAYDKTHNR